MKILVIRDRIYDDKPGTEQNDLHQGWLYDKISIIYDATLLLNQANSLLIGDERRKKIARGGSNYLKKWKKKFITKIRPFEFTKIPI